MPDCSNLQLEHILPKKAEGEYWARHWPDANERLEWTHRLGNLAPLNQKSNAKASNKSFSTKKGFYTKSPYPLTNDLQQYDVWNRETVQLRHQELIHLASEIWGL